jgi:hypothetical protein
MKNLRFKEWMATHESTTTASVAMFARPVGMIIRRNFAKPLAVDKTKKTKKN